MTLQQVLFLVFAVLSACTSVSQSPNAADEGAPVDALTQDLASETSRRADVATLDLVTPNDVAASTDTLDAAADAGAEDVETAQEGGPSECSGPGDCDGDTQCVDGQCVPFGAGEFDETCAKTVTPGVFFPALQCEWSGPPEGDAFPQHRNVLGSPTVVSFPFGPNPSGGADGSGGQVVFVSYALTDGGLSSGNCCGVIRIIDGATCQQLWTLGDQTVVGGSNLAIGDLNLDGQPEIVALAEGGGLVAFGYDPTSAQFAVLWRSVEADGTTPDTFGDGTNRWNGPSLVDLTGDEHPEVLYEGNVYDHTGVKIAPGLGWLSYQQGLFPVAADVDLDGEPEVMVGVVAHRLDDATLTLVPESYADASLSNGHVALADFGDTMTDMPAAAAEIVLVSQGGVRVVTLDGTVLFGPYPLPGGGTGGPPTIADFDGDGEPEFACAGSTRYTVFDLDCVGTPLPDNCESEGVRWSKLSQDESSNKTGSSVFDFEADGSAEAVYGDECFVRTYDGSTGDVLYSGPRSSCTWHEQPVIADVDGDFRTEIVIGSNNNCNVQCPVLDPIHGGLRCDADENCVSGTCLEGKCRCSQTEECLSGYTCAPMLPEEEDGLGQVCRAEHTGKLQGIRVYRDAQDSWAQSRRIWNQHAYFVTNIEEDGRVPSRAEQVPNWTLPGLNDFRRNSQGDLPAQGASDLTVKASEDAVNCGDGTYILSAEVCNRGVIPVGSGVSMAFHAADPSLSLAPICVRQTSEAIAPGQCIPVSCEVDTVDLPNDGFWVTVDAAESYLECNEGNNSGTSEFDGCQ